jgi:hypothetical protein
VRESNPLAFVPTQRFGGAIEPAIYRRHQSGFDVSMLALGRRQAQDLTTPQLMEAVIVPLSHQVRIRHTL